MSRWTQEDTLAWSSLAFCTRSFSALLQRTAGQTQSMRSSAKQCERERLHDQKRHLKRWRCASNTAESQLPAADKMACCSSRFCLRLPATASAMPAASLAACALRWHSARSRSISCKAEGALMSQVKMMNQDRLKMHEQCLLALRQCKAAVLGLGYCQLQCCPGVAQPCNFS